MFRSKILPGAMAGVIALGAAGGVAQARDNERAGEHGDAQERAAVLNAKTSLAQAIVVAEQATGGKAIETGLENQDGNIAFEVEVAKGDTVQKVLVDPKTGTVLKVMAAGERGGTGHEDED